MEFRPGALVSPTSLSQLKENLASFEELSQFLCMIQGARSVQGLRKALADGVRLETFLNDTLPQIVVLAKASAWEFQMYETKSSFTLSRGNISWLLANAFFLNVYPQSDRGCGNLDWARLYESVDPVGQERLKAFLSFFNVLPLIDKNEHVQVRRVKVPDKWPNDKVLDEIIDVGEKVKIHYEPMETCAGQTNSAIVDFANAQIHIGKIIESGTQEEVLFSSCPELFALLPLVEKLKDNEALIVDGVLRICNFSGYLDEISFEGIFDSPFVPQEIVVIDAVRDRHFSESLRDISKAFIGFSNAKADSISSGFWGCGIFGGNITHKFVQQLVAAQLARKDLYFSCYLNEDEMQRLEKFVECLKVAKLTFRDLLNHMQNYAVLTGAENDDDFSAYSSALGSGSGFDDYLMDWLSKDERLL